MDRSLSVREGKPGDRSGGSTASGPDAGALVRVSGLDVRFDLPTGGLTRSKKRIMAVDGVSFALPRGRTLGLVGSTGSGKSTVAHVVMGMVEPTAGSVTVAGHDLAEVKGADRLALQRLRQVVLQDPYSSLDPRMRVGDIIAEPLTLGRRSMRRRRRREVADRVEELLGLVGLPPGKADLYPHQFSGGQRQRISIARALAPRPELIVLDEPTSALDVSVRAQILNLLKDLQTRLGVTYLVISHDLVTVAYLATDVAVMHGGRIVEMGTMESLYRAPRHPCTLELLASAPGAEGTFLARPRPAGKGAVLADTACRFADRCALRARLGEPARCVDVDPVLATVEEGHRAACHFPNEVAELVAEARSGQDP